MRSAPLVAAAEAVRARLDAQIRPDNPHNKITNRSLVSAVLQRADEPGEMIAYWLSRHGRRIPISVKRGITDAIIRLYTERALLKYDTAEHPVRFGDVVDLVQPATHVPAIRGTWRYDLYGHAIDRRHGRDRAIPEPLTTLHSRAALMAVPVEQRRDLLGQPGTADMLRTAGVTWEALAGWLQGPLDATARSAVIPSMGLFGLVRNLRNLDEAGVPDQVAETVAARLADPVLIARSRMFPFRFWAVYKNTASLRWAQALEQALVASLANVPTLPGRTLVLVDRSPSMFPGHGFSAPNRSDISLAERAAVFGAAVALRAEQATLVEYGFTSRPVSFRRGGSLLRLVEAFDMIGGTDTGRAVAAHYRGHDRVLIITDEQTTYTGRPNAAAAVPDSVPVYTWNLGGYRYGHGPSGIGQRHTFGGLTDAAFRVVPLIESGRTGAWPWQV